MKGFIWISDACFYATAVFLTLYLIRVICAYFHMKRTCLAYETVLFSDNAGKALVMVWLAVEYMLQRYLMLSESLHGFLWKYALLWSIFILCVIIEKSTKRKGFRLMIRRIVSKIFQALDTSRDFVKRCSKNSQRWSIVLLVIIGAQCFIFPSSITGAPLITNILVLSLLMVYSLTGIYKAMYSATWLCITWLIGGFLFGTFLYDFFSKVLLSISSLHGNEKLFYCFFVVAMNIWWCITICWAEDRPAQIAASLISTLIGLITAIANIMLLVIRPALSDVPSDADIILPLSVNLFLLPLLSASLISKFIKELQIYWREKYPWQNK